MSPSQVTAAEVTPPTREQLLQALDRAYRCMSDQSIQLGVRLPVEAIEARGLIRREIHARKREASLT